MNVFYTFKNIFFWSFCICKSKISFLRASEFQVSRDDGSVVL